MKAFRWLLVIFPFALFSQTAAQEAKAKARAAEEQAQRPKLVVGIVVDQMRNDFISRYWSRFSDGGFRRLVNEGFYFKNNHFNYIPTYTGPGHSSIYTGAAPRAHGIIANDWFVKKNGASTYCVLDTAVRGVGTQNQSGQMSPRNQLASTVGDELKMTTNKRGKVFAVALKDRSAILPAGHSADAAFWFDEQSGNFVSSTWYLNELPDWLKRFNDQKLAKRYLESGWSTMAYPEGYVASIADDNPYESVPNKKDRPTFPYSYRNYIEKNSFGIIRATPFGNSITKDLAIECIKSEQLGKDAVTDLFCISFSSTDIIAHSYGPRSVEVEDTYLRLDKDIEEILNTLDKEVGKNNYVVFLTADHGGADVPKHLLDNKIPAGYLWEKVVKKEVQRFCQSVYGDSLFVRDVSNEQIFLNESRVWTAKQSVEDVEESVARFLLTIPGIAEAYGSKTMKNGSFPERDYRSLLQNGYNHALSGNVCYLMLPAWMDYAEKGTTHGAGYNYDTHVPLIFFGKGVRKGHTQAHTVITQIAPTVCELMQINRPNATTAGPLNDFFR